VASRNLDKRPAYSKADESELILKGYIAFLDPPKETAGQAIAALQHNGVAQRVTNFLRANNTVTGSPVGGFPAPAMGLSFLTAPAVAGGRGGAAGVTTGFKAGFEVGFEAGFAPSSPIWRNWITFAGTVVASGALFAFLLLLTLDLTGKGAKNPYMGILCYIVAPGFLIAGLALVFGGAWQEHRRRVRRPNTPAPRVAIDLSRPRDRRILFWFVAGATSFLMLTAVGSYQTFQYTESVPFCGEVCHKVMEPEFTTYQAGAHARVACVECHIGSGAAWYVKAKVSGLYQVYSVVFHKYEQPIPTPVRNLRPARDTCERCHWPEKYSGSIEVTHHHFMADDQNTP